MDNIEVAKPLRDKGVDLIAYLDAENTDINQSCFLQLKASSDRAFSFHEKYQRVNNVRIVHVWHLNGNSDVRIFCTTHEETKALCAGYSWSYDKHGNAYWNTSSPSKELMKKLERYEVTRGDWKQLLFSNA